MIRSAELQAFYDATRHALAASNAGYAARALADRIFTALEDPADQASFPPQQLPVCQYLGPALNLAREQGGPIEALADALCGVAPRLIWARRPFAHDVDPAFQAGHANAVVVGEDGLEIRHDIWIGISLLAPQTHYPDHRHPPEEIYSVLSPGEWKQNDGPWHSPGIGEVVHNPPNIIHGMRSKSMPLLAVWCLWTG
jgi:hypothetical protein